MMNIGNDLRRNENLFVLTILVKHHENLDELLLTILKQLHKDQVISSKERLIVVRASPLVPGKTNIIEVFTVEEVLQAKLKR